LTEKRALVQLCDGCWGLVMSNRLSPAFHAEYLVELFNEYRSFEKVSERANILLSSYPAEHVQAIEKYLPRDLIVVLPKRRLINSDFR
jgi:hypothetical protein